MKAGALKEDLATGTVRRAGGTAGLEHGAVQGRALSTVRAACTVQYCRGLEVLS